MKKFYFLATLVAISSCTPKQQQSASPPALYAQPKTVVINTSNGYEVNPITGDTVQPIINSLGDTVKTGVFISAQGKYISADSVIKPNVVAAGTPTIVPAHPNVRPVPANAPYFPIDQAQINTIIVPKILNNDTTHYILNSAGKKVRTGIPIALKGVKVKAVQPKPVIALPPRMKETASYDIRYLDAEQGMNSSYIFSIIKSRSGKIWMGSDGGGISVYDGKSFMHYTTGEGLSSNQVRCLMEDRHGKIWIATFGGGISVFDGKDFTHYTEKDGLSSNNVYCLLEDKDGKIWIGTYGNGISVFDGKNIVHYTQKEGLVGHTIQSMLEDKSGNIWTAASGKGICVFNGKSFTHYTQKEGLSTNVLSSLLQDNHGNIWIGTLGGGVNVFNGRGFTRYGVNEGLGSNDAVGLKLDKNGNIWMATTNGAVVYNGKNFTQYEEKDGLSNNVLISLFEDESGKIWMGTFGGGINIFHRKGFMHYGTNDGLSSEIVLSMLEDRKGKIWMGTRGAGVNIYNEADFAHYSQPQGLGNTYIISLLEDKKGNIWMGTFGGGVFVYDGNNFTQYTTAQGLLKNDVYGMVEDGTGKIWICSRGGGVSVYNGKGLTQFTENDGLSSNAVTCFIKDKTGKIWMGTSGGGISMFDGKGFINYSEKEGLSNNDVRCLMEDREGNIWIGTHGGGVCIMKGNKFIHYGEKEGLSNNLIWSIKQDKQGTIWLSTEKGITSLLPVNEKQYKIINYQREDGLKAVDFFSNSALMDSKNRLWLGSGKCLTMLDLKQYKPGAKIPQPVLRQLEINERFFDYHHLPDSLKNELTYTDVASFENYPLELKLPYDRNHLTFRFSAIDWAAPHKIKYQYTLAGSDKSWSEITDKTFADYRNIPYGTYTFKVRAMGESQQWSKPFEYTFTIYPPWWHSTWFRIMYVSCFIILLYLLYRWRTATLRKRQVFLERTVDERTAEVVKQKEIIEEKHKEITDSINYAERIQRSFLAAKQLLDKNLENYFVLFNPKEAVSGDFYWATELDNGTFAYVCADSTGHGVPGAIMSLLNITSLIGSVKEGHSDPGEILNHTRKSIIERLKHDGSAEGGKDGMDASLIVLNKERNKLLYAAANNPVWIIRNNEIIELNPDKMPVGKHDKDSISFTTHTIEIQNGDLIYSLTDGFPDQFGGPKGKKYKYASLKEFLLSIANLPMNQQKEKLEAEFSAWKGELEQIDDVCIIGVRI